MRSLISLSLVVFFLASCAAVAQSAQPCPINATSIQGGLRCYCAQGATPGTVWGTGTYTSDSNICSAARHAGMIGQAGGEVELTMLGRQESFPASTMNGVTSSQWGAWDSSFAFVAARPGGGSPCGTMPAGAELHECTCSPAPHTGNAWGSGPYTNDSNICVAAMHAGVITSLGGAVRVLAAPGLQSYRGSEWNGTSTLDYGAWSGSITFDRN